MGQKDMLETRLLSSLTKVFADEELNDKPWNKGSMLSNEVYSFQVAYCWHGELLKEVDVHIVSELSPYIKVRKVGLVPSEMPCYVDHDENILRSTPGLYPDSLLPLDDEKLTFLPEQWRSIWITVDTCGSVVASTYPIEIIFETASGELLGKEIFELELLQARLPRQTLIQTQWFHTDCLATWYGVDVFSEEHWNLIDKFIKTATKHGINMILTPIFTPPLDTEVGGERPTVQLVDVYKAGDAYRFEFDKLKRWIELCISNGVEYFEFSHLFTQWGAKHAPKIMAVEDGEYKRIFGWDTDAAGGEYKNFLDQFLPELINFIKENNLEQRSYFHVSDEPSLEHLDSYRNASNILNKYLKDFPVIDALSNYQFYEDGLVKKPIPATDHIEAFLENNVENLWAYYCCGQYKEVSNRFFNMPSARNRILGIQLYKFNIEGFLQWGYNFWYSQYSRYPINPFCVTDAGYGFPSGDAFVVYPGKDGPLESLRLEVFYEAIQDLRALKLLEDLIGREAVLDMLEAGLDAPITFSQYPKDMEWILSKREQINRKIAECSKY
ncbi:DUF4091 domain-containing protein [Xylanivirga thermophila]|uniref:DUF4091 domain-containing protein n=1 Tax=Xylanivirga thermophila TaxID=2496273 RepID=UPI001FB34FD5|nr:DUF4091 domain-containing protein [Xylanivirga thermophila]